MILPRRTRFVLVAALLVLAANASPLCAQADSKPGVVFDEDDDRPHVVFVTGDDEYRSEITMPMIAKILEERHNMRCSIAYAVDTETNERSPKFKTNIVGLEALEEADLAVFFMRFRALPPEQFKMIKDYCTSDRPFVGLRTSTHAFLYPPEDERAEWNDRFGIRFFGQKWITHHGHTSSTDVTIIPEQAEHPILRGIEPFHCQSWLYHVEPLVGDCLPLLRGTSVDSEKGAEEQQQYPPVQPVAWTKVDATRRDDRRVFFTTLGHPADFEQESMRRLLINGIYWTLREEIPEGGTNAETVGEYVAPPTH